MITALIAGIGGTNSLAILKSLNLSKVEHRSVGTEIKALNAGSILSDVSYLIPKVSDEAAYKAALIEIIKKENVNIIFATTETEIAYLASVKEELQDEYGLTVMVADTAILEISQDKYKTQEFLKHNQFVYIPTTIAHSLEAINQFVAENGFPVIRKPIYGYGSRGVDIIRNQDELDLFPVDDDYVLQAYIESDETDGFDEYTSEVFVNKDGSIAGGIVIQRTLLRGESNNGKVIRDDETLGYLKKVAQTLGVKGPCNFQYRMKDGKPYIFEINARYSGTSAVRAHFGFNNVDLALKSFVNNDHTVIEDNAITEGYFVRYWEEAYITVPKLDQFKKDGFNSHE